MTRHRREMDDEGRLLCGSCGESYYIWNFYTIPVFKDLTPAKDIWFESNGILYGRPKSYCRKCNRIAQKGKDALDVWRTVCVNRRLNRIDDPIVAETKAYYEDNKREFQKAKALRLSQSPM